MRKDSLSRKWKERRTKRNWRENNLTNSVKSSPFSWDTVTELNRLSRVYCSEASSVHVLFPEYLLWLLFYSRSHLDTLLDWQVKATPESSSLYVRRTTEKQVMYQINERFHTKRWCLVDQRANKEHFLFIEVWGAIHQKKPQSTSDLFLQ